MSPTHLPHDQDSPSQRVPVAETLDELLSPGWLTAALGDRFPGITVTSVTRGPVVSRVSTNLRFRIECADGVPDGLVPDLCAKSYFSEAGWPARHVGIIETSFFRDLAADSLRQFALLHAATWCDPIAMTAPWLTPRAEARTVHRGVAEIRANFESADLGPGVPQEARDAERLHATFRDLAVLTHDTRPWAVVHGDAHIGNLYLDGAGRPSLLDWQLVQRGPWYLDVGYHIASALTVADRRACEDDLLRHYLGELHAAGAARGTAITVPTPDEARLGYRLGILYGFYHWGITKLVDRPITGALLHRLGTAVADHDAYNAVADARATR